MNKLSFHFPSNIFVKNSYFPRLRKWIVFKKTIIPVKLKINHWLTSKTVETLLLLSVK